MTDRWRCFVAVPLGEELRRDLSEAATRWRSEPALDGMRWVPPESWHVTLAFLGPTDPDEIAGVIECVRAAVDPHRPRTVSTGGLGAFPTPASARVAWYGVTASPDLDGLARDLHRALDLDALDVFRPHVTLARARRRPVDLRAWLASARAPDGVLSVDRLDLMRSHVSGGPARYETVASVPLGAPVGG